MFILSAFKNKFGKPLATVLATALVAGSVPIVALAATSGSLPATTAGTYSQWSVVGTGLTGGNCTTNYLSETTNNDRSSFNVDISSIPNGSTITSVAVTPSDRDAGSGTPTYRVFARLNGVNTDGSSLTATTNSGCTVRSAQTLNVADTVKSGTTTLEIGVDRTNSSGVARVGSLSVVVTYTPTPHTITATAGVGGFISPSGAVAVDDGDDKTFTITPSATYIVSDLSVDAGSVGMLNSYTFSNVTADHTIEATFDGGWSKPTDTDNDDGVSGEDNAFTSNNSRAIFDSSSDDVEYDDFGLSIPEGAVIEGIEVAVEGYRTSGRTLDLSLTWDNGSTYTSVKNVGGTFSSSDKTVIAGSSSDTWGHVWTANELSDSNFKVKVDATSGGGDIAVDQIQVRVTYSEPEEENPSVTTDAATGISTSDATLNGTNGPVAGIGHSFWVSLATYDTSSPNIPADVYSTPDFGAVGADSSFNAALSLVTTDGIITGGAPGNMSAITPNTTYYFNAWVNVDGTWYPGEILTLTTEPEELPEFVTVTIVKYLDDEQATAENATSTSFAMTSSWDAENLGGIGNGSYSLNPSGFGDGAGPYEAITSLMTSGADYSTEETIDGDIVGTCGEGAQYSLTGYRVGNTLDAAENADIQSEVNLEDITTNKFVIVENHYCDEPVEASTVTVKIKKYIDGEEATEESAQGVVFHMQSSWTDTPSAGAGTYTLEFSNDFTAETFPLQMGTADYTTSETFDNDTAVACEENAKFGLVGYSYSEISFADAASQEELSLTPPSFTNLQNNAYVIVWNETCVYEPLTGTLTIIKEVINNDDGTSVASDFSFEVTDESENVTGVGGSEEGETVELVPGTYTITELNGEGYTASFSEACAEGTVTVVAGENVTCTVTNDDNPSEDNGGGDDENNQEEDNDDGDNDDNTTETSSGTGFGGFSSFSSGGQVLGASTGPDGEGLTCPAYLTNFIFPGSTDIANIVALQIFLNAHENAGLAITGVYDAPTIAAVNALQAKYANEILKPWYDLGLLPGLTPTGNVYKMTLWWINVTVCGITTTPPVLP